MKHHIYTVSTLVCSLIFSSCGSNEKSNTDNNRPQIEDPHTLSNYQEVQVQHLDLDVAFDFENKSMQGIATWSLTEGRTQDTLVLDTDELTIDSVVLDSGVRSAFRLAEAVPIHGSALHIPLAKNTKKVSIYYQVEHRADDTFAALQWLEPEQSFDKKMPFLFTKSEPTMSRCWIPCQDLPSIRITYTAKVKVAPGILALMSASNPQEKNDEGVYHFEMNNSIPIYLVALAAGNLGFKAIDDRIGVYAEPSFLEKSAEEFSETPQMMRVAESLVGPYRWSRYDIIVLPKGFPIGGMENPLLTFVTPTIIAGDKSLVTLIAHELAHSWAGNQVTNASWNDLWVNEGLTVYLERRIMEAIRGKDYVDMLWTLGRQDLDWTIEKLGADSDLTKLKLNLKNQSPLESFTDIAYEKGAHFIWALEQTVGRSNLDSFLRNYYDRYAFQGVSTEMFIDEMEKNLLSKNDAWSAQLNYIEWIFNPGLPENCPQAGQKLFSIVDEQRARYEESKDLSTLQTENWSTHEWLHFLRNLNTTVTANDMVALDAKFNLSRTGNSEIAAAWYLLAVPRNYTAAFGPMTSFLMQTGRGKFLEPLYETLRNHQPKLAKEIFEQGKNNYHPNVRRTISNILAAPPST